MLNSVVKKDVMNRLLSVLAISLLSACHHGAETQVLKPTSMGNPASVYCQQQGGRVSYSKSHKGITGYCLLPDGQLIDEWKLYKKI